MRGRWWITALVLVGLAGVAVVSLLAASGAAGPSTLSRAAGGWLAARLYLEARGTEVDLLRRALTADDPPSSVVTAFPWRRLVFPSELEALRGWVEAGGRLAVAYSSRLPSQQEVAVFSILGAELVAARGEPPLGLLAWRRYMAEEWRLEAADPAAAAGPDPGIVRAPQQVPGAPEGARVLYRVAGDETVAAVFTFPLGEGEVVVFPADALANAYLGRGGNAQLLESLRSLLGPGWSFDEFHHGLVEPEAAASAVPTRAVDLFVLHLGVLYVLSLLALGRRFGPPWRERPPRSGSAATFLRGLGELHHRLRHHPAAARLLLERVGELEPQLALPAELGGRAAEADGPGLVALAQEVARARAALRGGPGAETHNETETP